MSAAFIGLGHFDEAVAAAKKAVRQNPLYPAAYRCLAIALAHQDAKQKRGRQRPVCSNSNPVFAFLNGLSADG
jgi:adenylate cyclase